MAFRSSHKAATGSWLLVLMTILIAPCAFYSAVQSVRSNENHIEDWLPKSLDETQRLAWFREHFETDQFVVISWDGCVLGLNDEETDDPRIAKVAELLCPGSSASPAPVSPTTKPIDQLTDRELVDRFIKSVDSGRSVLNRLTAEPLGLSTSEAAKRLKGILIGADQRQTCLIVALTPEASSHLKLIVGAGRQRLVGADIPPGLVHRALQSAGVPLTSAHFGGPPVDNAAIDEEGERTLIRLAGLSGLLGIGLAWWSLRSLVLTAIVFFCAILSASISLGCVWITNQNMDAILMSMPSLVYVLAISGSIHLISYYREAVSTGGLTGAGWRAVRMAIKPALLCSITTAIGLLSLSTSELVPIKKFGIYSAFGVLALMAIVYIVIPAALDISGIGHRWIAQRTKSSSELKPASGLSRIWEWLAGRTIQHYRALCLFCAATMAVVGIGLSKTQSSVDLLKLFDEDAKILHDYRWFEAHIGKLVPMEIVLVFPQQWQKENASGSSAESISPRTLVQRMELVSQLQSVVSQKFGESGSQVIGQSLSAATFAPTLPRERTGMKAVAYRTAINKRLVADKSELMQSGYLAVDEQGSELWRISLRVAAFNDVDYGAFTQELRSAAQPFIDAQSVAIRVLNQLERTVPTGAQRRVLLWTQPPAPADSPDAPQASWQDQRFGELLKLQLKYFGIDVQHIDQSPSLIPLSSLNLDGQFGAVVTCGNFPKSDTDLIGAFTQGLIQSSRIIANAQVGSNADAQLGLQAVFTGVVPIVYQAQRALLNSLAESTIWSFMTITPIMMLVTRSIIGGMVAMLPNLLPILLVFGGMGWLGIPVDIGSLMTASIALGVAVDDTIHFLARYRKELGHCDNRQQAISNAYCHCAIPTLQSALISGLGLSVFAFSTFTPTQRFGWLMLAILFAGVIAEFLLLPALLASPLGKFFKSKPTPAPVNQSTESHLPETHPLPIQLSLKEIA